MIAWLSVAELVKHIWEKGGAIRKRSAAMPSANNFPSFVSMMLFSPTTSFPVPANGGMPAVFALLSSPKEADTRFRSNLPGCAGRSVMYSLSCWVAVSVSSSVWDQPFRWIECTMRCWRCSSDGADRRSMGGGSEASTHRPTSNCCCDGSAIRVSRNC